MLGDVWHLVGVEAMRQLDRHSIDGLGIPGELLMETAGRVVVREILGERSPGAPVFVVIGGGNNGGDGLVVARHLHLLGVPVRLRCVVDPEQLSGDAASNWRRAQAVGVPLADTNPPPAGAVVVDAVFGTGLSRPVAGAAAEAIAAINASRASCRVVAVDLPSGLDADTGQELGSAVRAHATVCLGLPKLGLALSPGRELAGRIVIGRIGIADEAPGLGRPAELWTRAAAGRRLPPRPAHGHKGSFGHALVAAGSEGKTGAAVLAAAGAARVGAGLVTIACPASANAVLESQCTEAMTAPLPETAARTLAAAAEKPLLELAESRDAVVLGPGLGRVEETLALVRRLAAGLARPLVLDADALLAFADAPDGLRARSAATILTPHPGEAAALLGGTAGAINADRPAAARRLAEATGAVVLLKGAASVIAAADGRLAVNPTGGPLLATGGTGDVLAGVVGGLLCQGSAPFEAAALGAFVHGLAADLLALRRGPVGALAGEVAESLPIALRELERAARGASLDPLGAGDAVAFPEPG